MPNFWPAAKLGKASRDADNSGLSVILEDLFKNWVAEGVPSNINDFIGYIFSFLMLIQK